MIVKMKKISVVLQDKDIREALNVLAEVGVLHLEYFDMPKGEELDRLREEQQHMTEVLSMLGQINPRPEQKGCSHEKQMFINVHTSLRHIKELEEQIQDYQAQIIQWQPWGTFDPREILDLEKSGVYVKFYLVPEVKLPEFPEDLVAETLLISNAMARVAVFSLEEIDLDFEEIQMPEFGLNHWKERLEKAQDHRQEFRRFISESAKFIDVFEQRLKRVEQRVAYQEALTGRNVQDGFSVVQGFCPVDLCDVFEDKAKKEQWAYLIQDPEEEDDVPTLLRNPRWIQLVNPVFQMASILPGYKEIDVSVIFLFFFSLFFGMLIGDAGYGVIFELTTFFLQKKIGKTLDDQMPFVLLYILSLTAIIWGVLTGTYFGQQWIKPYVAPLLPWLTKNSNVQELCFFLGALQLSLAHIWRGFIRLPSISAGTQFGWALWIWGMYFLVRQLIVVIPMPGVSYGLMIGGVAMIVLCTAPNKNIFKMILGGFGEFMGGSINSFTDIISYIRLFAVGLATVAMADAFNGIASEVGFHNVVTGFGAALILFVGHSINIMLAAMAILVHGLRLNILEFSSHMGIQWSGIKYKPFKKEAAGS